MAKGNVGDTGQAFGSNRETGRKRYGLVEALRSLAACGVIWAHLPEALHKEFGHAGLIAFMLLSVVFQAAESERYSFVQFMGKRSSSRYAIECCQ